MQRRKKEHLTGDAQLERQIVMQMILSQYFLREIAKVFKADSLTLSFAKTVAAWCIDYYKEFKDAPRQHIEDIFRRKKETIRDDATSSLLEEFLFSLSEEYKRVEGKFNDDYILKEAERYFRVRGLAKARDDIGRAISSGKVEDGEAVISSFHRIARPASVGIDPFRDLQYVEDAFNTEDREIMFAMPGDLGRMLGPFHRGWFGMVVGTQGRGKTWWLMEVGMRALLKGFNVLFLSMEMTEKQMIRRMYHWLTGLPNKRWSGQILLPVFDCLYNQDGSCNLKERAWRGRLLSHGKDYPEYEASLKLNYKVCTVCRGIEDSDFSPSSWHKARDFEPMNIEDGVMKAEIVAKSLLRGAKLKLVTAPAGNMAIKDLKVAMENWEHYEGWLPDVVITDYSDKMAPDNRGEREYRHRINDINVAHKGLALDKNILVMTASQSSTGRNEERDIDSGDYAEDIRKRSEIDVGWSLNQTAVEKRRGIMRVRSMKQRHEYYDVLESCIVLSQLKLGKPYLDSCLARKF